MTDYSKTDFSALTELRDLMTVEELSLNAMVVFPTLTELDVQLWLSREMRELWSAFAGWYEPSQVGDKRAVEDELADVVMCAWFLARKCDINLAEAIHRKGMEVLGRKRAAFDEQPPS